MMQDLSEHPFSQENVAFESGALNRSERAWIGWTGRVERLIGHSLDGDQRTDGYSLDFAHVDFEAGYTPEYHASKIAKNKARIKQAADMKARFGRGEFHKP